ncbi:MAG TPA: DinB family protein, partial [Chitinophagaceae bacterium]|nr:DinB family protein [Chitinophagaceae bacterium]
FDKDESIRSYQSSHGGWTINQILEHISSINHFLIVFITKGTNYSIHNVVRFNLEEKIRESDFNLHQLDEFGVHKFFHLSGQGNVQPNGEKDLTEVRELLKDQVRECLSNLDKLSDGEGVLASIQMTKYNLESLNVYEIIYFLAMHGKKHLCQMTTIEADYHKFYQKARIVVRKR